ncbi:MAG: hypothetical protein ACSLE6_08215 [Mycobacterium sp.]
MKKSLVVVAAAAALCATLAGPAGVTLAEPEEETVLSASDTIAGLQAEGYSVTIDRLGSGSIDDCVVTSIRNPQEQWRSERDNDGDRVRVLVSKTIIVSLAC